MRIYNDVYPLFMRHTHKMKTMIVQQIELKKFSNPNSFLFLLENEIRYLEMLFAKNPSVNAQNLAAILNSEYSKAKNGEIDGVIVFISFKKNASRDRFSQITLNIGK